MGGGVVKPSKFSGDSASGGNCIATTPAASGYTASDGWGNLPGVCPAEPIVVAGESRRDAISRSAELSPRRDFAVQEFHRSKTFVIDLPL
jgi:hypothetical protein